MSIEGKLRELSHHQEKPIAYYLHVGEERIYLNPHVGDTIEIKHQGGINCIYCGRQIKKTYNSGYCYPCFRDLPQNDLCIVKPNLCHFDKGTCRDENFGKEYCFAPHYVYLALSSDVKVGLTKKTNAFKRWVDQGAVQAIPIAELPTRKIAGELEYFLTDHLPDKTNWRKMLSGDIVARDILQVREDIFELIPIEYHSYLLNIEEINEFIYPALEQLEKINSLTLDKEPSLSGKLLAIKGQYLILDSGVFNIKKHSGYSVDVKFDSGKIK